MVGYKRKYIISFFTLIVFIGCQKSLQNDQSVYSNDFESKDLANTEGVVINNYNGSNVAGYYNDDQFSVSLNALPSHDYVKISFDLYIHNYWDGNSTGNMVVITGPDIWSMKVDDSFIIQTTFSNTVCNVIYCLQQSYPNNYPFQNNPQSGAYNTNLPGLCGNGGITTLYKIEKLVKHSKASLLLTFGDLLKQSNVTDKLCDEAWSLDNLKISTVVSN